ncbi:hypothetical protein BKA65DRAFT_513298 [Rhexocercosporidium sp. MPI-PUGE-AT-0058]|nr:hypothetical protein BKA65DRAFT_513298 [Rhexocercosporidium sp. MPI-PUGE-AT-0058]
MATSSPPTRATFADTPATLSAAINSFFSGPPETTESDLLKLFTPTFTQRDDSNAPSGSRDFPAFVEHIRWLREILPPGSVNVKVTHFMKDGNQIAERHSGDPMTLEDGSIVHGETFMWIELAEDGRIEGVVETVRKMVLRGPTRGLGEVRETAGE